MSHQRDPIVELHRLLVGHGPIDGELAERLRQAFARWVEGADALTLPACLGLHGRPYLVRLHLRDLWLREAARIMRTQPSRENLSDWQLAKRLQSAVVQFRGSHWQTWRRNVDPPWTTASEVEIALHYAHLFASQMPGTVRQYLNVLNAGSEMNTEADFTPPMRQSN